MPDYSEFPTTPTAWQEAQWQEARWQAAQELATEDPPRASRRVDLVALVPGIVFCVLAVTLMSGIDLPLGLFRDGGIAWVLLIGVGVVLLVGELRKVRGRR